MSSETQQLLSEKVRGEIDKWLAKFPPEQKRSVTLYALRITQEDNGWLTETLMDAVAEYIGIPKIWVYEVATFYSMYDLQSRGKHKIGVCCGISCMLCGSHDIVRHIQNRLKVGFNESTEDGKFYLKEVECLAACAGGPAMIIDDKHYHENLTPEKVDELLNNLE